MSLIKTTMAFSASTLMLISASAYSEESKPTLGFIGLNMIYPAVVAMADGFEERAKELGANTVVLDARSSAEAASNAIDDLIGQDISGIAALPVDSIASETWIDKTDYANIPLVAVAAQIGDPYTRSWNDVYPGVSALVGKDDVLAGEDAAKLALPMLPEGRKAKIAILEGAPGFVAAVQRSKGFRKGLDEAGANYEIVSSQPTDWTPEKGESVCQNVLVSHPDVDLFFSHADDMAIGCARAIEANESNAKLIATTGGSSLGLAAIAAGELDGTVCMPWKTVGELTAQALYEAVMNPNTPKGRVVNVKTPLVTKDTLSDCPVQW